MDALLNQPNALNYALSSFRDNTEQTTFYESFPNFKVTFGVRYAAEWYCLQWLIYIIFTSQQLNRFQDVDLQVWHLQRIKDDKLLIIVQDALGSVIIRIKFTDLTFKYDYFKMLWVDGLLLLPSETMGKN